ncbi:translation initiation factor IF-2-like [Corvus hawaiiensis]|uniref:translation initiation factor IF-2-like n=1 Tax=Corvus hawaiiensis TaxID=134902 RepID=UPI002019FF39|nr:translation initiation factor IF-2-like [Corvus hawaiiensis]
MDPKDLSVSQRISVSPNGSQQILVGPSQFQKIPASPNGSQQILVGPSQFQKIPASPNGSQQILIPRDPSVSQRIPVGPSRSQQTPAGPSGSPRLRALLRRGRAAFPARARPRSPPGLCPCPARPHPHGNPARRKGRTAATKERGRDGGTAGPGWAWSPSELQNPRPAPGNTGEETPGKKRRGRNAGKQRGDGRKGAGEQRALGRGGCCADDAEGDAAMNSAPGFSSALSRAPGMLRKGCQRGGYQPASRFLLRPCCRARYGSSPGLFLPCPCGRRGRWRCCRAGEVPVGAGPCGAVDFSVLEPTLPSR